MMILPIEGLTPAENAALIENLDQLTKRRPRAEKRSNFYNTKKILDKAGFSIPPSMANLDAVLGWPTKTVDGLSSRLGLKGFVVPGTKGFHTGLQESFAENRMDVEWPQIQTSTFIHGCSFVAVTPGDKEQGEPEALILTMAATEATGIWDVRKRSLKSAMWLPEADAAVNKVCILFMPENTVQMTRNNGFGPWQVKRIPNKLKRVPVTPVVYRGQLGRPFGMSRISRAVMYLCQMAARSLLRLETSAEFYSSPQRYAMGASAEDFQDEHGNAISAWDTILGKTWLIGRDEEGDIPTVGQFPQMTMQPHVEMLRMVTTMFAGESSLPVGSLGILHDNPASAAAIDAAWADMVSLAELCQVELGVALREIAQNVEMTKSGASEVPKELLLLRAKWMNASTPTLAAQTDAVTKQIIAGMLQPDSEVALEQAGYDVADIERIQNEHAAAKAEQAKQMAALGDTLNGAPNAAGNPGAAPGKPVAGNPAQPGVGSGVAQTGSKAPGPVVRPVAGRRGATGGSKPS